MSDDAVVIGLVGLKGSGKTTALNAISELYDVQEIQLAKHLKDVCAEVFSIERDHLDNQDYKELPLRRFESVRAPRNTTGYYWAVFFILTYIATPLGRMPESLFKTIATAAYAAGLVILLFAMTKEVVPRGVILTKNRVKAILVGFSVYSDENLNKTSHLWGTVLTSPRHIAQFVGTDLLRNCIDPDIHLKIAAGKMNSSKINVVSDIRFKNEYDFFEKTIPGFFSMYINRPEVIPVDLESAPASERFVPEIGRGCHTSIINNGEKESFIDMVKETVNLIIPKSNG